MVEFTGKIKARDEQLRGALFSLTYALWNYSVKNQSTITVQTRLIQRFVALVQGISVYSDFIVSNREDSMIVHITTLLFILPIMIVHAMLCTHL